MYASIFNNPCFLSVLHTGPSSIPQRSSCEFFINHVSVSCSWAVSIHRGLLLPCPARRIYWTARAGRAAAARRRRERGKGASALLHYNKSDINQTNYVAATVSNPWRGNEMIRGRSQLNRERVNENINYLMIYWGSGGPHPPPISLPLRPPTTESVCFNWVIIRLLHLAESLDLSG